jgi:hypothetical protein
MATTRWVGSDDRDRGEGEEGEKKGSETWADEMVDGAKRG